MLPGVRGLRFQALHTDDAADAYARAVVQEVRGPFNLAADPVIDGQVLAELLEDGEHHLRAQRVRRVRRDGDADARRARGGRGDGTEERGHREHADEGPSGRAAGPGRPRAGGGGTGRDDVEHATTVAAPGRCP